MKVVLKSLGFLLLLISLIMIIIIVIPDNQYKRLAEKAAQKFTDRTLSIGELEITRNLTPSIEIKNVLLTNPQWADKKEMLTADKLNASLDLIELIKGKLNIDLSSQGLSIDLLRNTENHNNWQFKPDDSSSEADAENPSVEFLARFVLKHLNMNDFNVSFDDEMSNTHHRLSIKTMKVIETDDGKVQNITLDGSLDDMPISLTGNSGTFSEFGLNRLLPLDLQATLDKVILSFKGNIDAQSDDLNLLADIQISSPDLSIISEFTDQKLPPDWRDISGSARLTSKSGLSSLEDIQLSMKGGLELDITGSISDLNNFQGVDVAANATLESLSGLSIFTAEPLPDLGPVNFTGKFNSNNEKLSLNEAHLDFDGEFGSAQFTGEVGDLINVDLANLKADIRLPNLNIVKLFSDAQIPELGEIKLSSDLISDGPLDLSANDVKLEYDHNDLIISATGSINSIIKNGGELNMIINANIGSLAALNELTGTELPALGPVDLKTTVSGTFAQIRLNNVVAEISDDTLTGSISGDIGTISNFDAINFNTELSAPSIADLLAKLDVESTVNIPARLSAATEKNNDDINISEVNLSLGDSTITGEIALENLLAQSKRRKLHGNINVVKLNLDEVLNEKSAEEAAASPENSGIAIPDSPLPFSYIRENDLDITIDVGELNGSFVSLSNTTVKLTSDQGKFTLGPVDTKVNGGDTALEVIIDATTQPAGISVNTEINGFSIKQSGTLEGSDLLENDGTANAKLEFTSSGESIAAILGNSNGSGEVYVENLTIKNETIKFVSADLVTEAVAAINPLDEKSNTTKINCSAAKFDIKDGVFNTPNGYIADAEAFTITGEGKINFKDQTLDLNVNTNPKEGLGLGLGELARAIQIQGTLAEPKVGINAKGVAELGVSIGAAVATGGVSLLAQGQIEKLKANTELCSNVLK